MRKQTLMLTTWLGMPFLCLTLIMLWIFVTLDKDKLMSDAAPVGAGAGDAGNANALGQWIAGRDANAISDADRARREGIAIDPFSWPGGVLLTFEHDGVAGSGLGDPGTGGSVDKSPKLTARVVLTAGDVVTVFVRHPETISPGKWGVRLDPVGRPATIARISAGYASEGTDITSWPSAAIPREYIKPGDTQSSDPISIPVRIEIVMP
ncbi:MAG: hypothetical protein AB8C13_06245 [Phycisphaerales bacterium]